MKCSKCAGSQIMEVNIDERNKTPKQAFHELSIVQATFLSLLNKMI